MKLIGHNRFQVSSEIQGRLPGSWSFFPENKYLDDGLSGYYIFGEVLESTGFEYPNVSIVITNDSDDQSVVTPAGMSELS